MIESPAAVGLPTEVFVFTKPNEELAGMFTVTMFESASTLTSATDTEDGLKLAGPTVAILRMAPDADAVFETEPASISPWVTVWVAVQEIVAAGANVAGIDGVQPLNIAFTSVMDTLVSVTLPVLVATNK